MQKTSPIILLLVFSLFSLSNASFGKTGYMKAQIEKQWNITSTGSTNQVLLDGFFLLNNSVQKISNLETNGEFHVDGPQIRIVYNKTNPPNHLLVYARATVEVNYTPYFDYDEPVPKIPLGNPCALSSFSPQMQDMALSHASDSKLATAANLTYTIYKMMKYDFSFLGTNRPVSSVFLERNGVCNDYSHLLISMLGSLGIPSRYVTGYAMQNGTFSPHAWVEMQVGNDAIQLDPTFGEVGALSAERIGMQYSDYYYKTGCMIANGSSDAYDSVNATGDGELGMDVNVYVHELSISDHPQNAKAEYSYDPKSGNLNISITNPKSSYAIFNYEFLSPPETYGSDSHPIVIAPNSKYFTGYRLPNNSFKPGYTYSIPFSASVQGAKVNDTLVYEYSQPIKAEGGCAPAAFIVISLLCASVFLKFRNPKPENRTAR